MNQQENNFNMTGDEARVLMAALSTSGVSVPCAFTLQLYTKLLAISQVQPSLAATKEPQ